MPPKKRTKKTIKAPLLSSGKKIALIAPAFHFDRKLMTEGVECLKTKYGLEPVFLESVFDQSAYFAGSDQRRIEELYHWMTHPEVAAIMAIRGGYGCSHLYPTLLKKLRKHKNLKPKIFCGFSDLTVFLNGLYQDLGWVTFHSPHVVSRLFRTPLPLEEKTFKSALFTKKAIGVVTAPETITLTPGRARGKLVGGCLSLLISSLGTEYEVQTDGKILFLEDVTEQAYRLDRMLTQLLHAGKFSKVRGIVFGQMTDILSLKDQPKIGALEAIQMALEPILKEKKIPIIYNFPAGHGSPQVTFPIGCEVELRAHAKNPELHFLEAGVR